VAGEAEAEEEEEEAGVAHRVRGAAVVVRAGNVMIFV